MKLVKIKSNKQFSNLVIYGFGQGFNLVTPLLIAPYIISICGEKGFGKIGISMAIAFFLIVIVDYGIDITGVKEISVNRNDNNVLGKIISTAYTARLLLLIIVLVVSVLLFTLIPYFSREKTLFLFSLPIVIGQFINPTWILQGIENFKWISCLNILSKIIYVVGIFLCIKTSRDYIYANLVWGIGTITANFIAFVYLKSKCKISFSNTSKEKVRDYLKVNFSLFFSQIFVSLQLYFPIVLIGFIGGDVMAGKFRIVEQVIGMFKTYMMLFFGYVYPKVCYLLGSNLKAAMRFWKRYNGVNFIFITVAMAVLYAIANPVVTYFNPEKAEEITGFLRLAIFLPLVLAVSMPLKQLLLGWNNQKYYVRFTMGLIFFNGLLMAVLLYFYGIYGVLASLIITEAITVGIYAFSIKNKLFTAIKTV